MQDASECGAGDARRLEELERENRELRCALDLVDAHVCLLDESGKVLWVNDAWRGFAAANGADLGRCMEGADYLRQCVVAAQAGDAGAAAFADSLHRVLAGELGRFEVECSCHSPTEKRWFQARVVAVSRDGKRRIAVSHTDVSERRRTQELLHNAGVAMEQTDVEVFWLRADGGIADASDRACAALGYTRDELRRLRVFDIDSRHVEEAWPDRWRALREAGSLSFATVQRRKDGSEREIVVCANLLAQGGEEQVCAFVLDLSNLRRTAAALQASEARYRDLFEAAPDAVFLVGASGADAGRILDANGAAAAMHGYTREQLLTMRIDDLDSPEDAEAVPQRLQGLLAQGSGRFEVRHRRRDGSEFPVEVSACVATVHGQRCLVSFNRDISAKQRAEARLRDQQLRLELAARAGGIGFWDWDIAGNTVFFSPEWKAQIGYEPDEVADRYEEWESRLHPDDAAPTLAHLAAQLRGEVGDDAVEFRLRHKDGSYRWIYARGQVLRDAAGSPHRMVGCHVDVTARKVAEEDRATMTRRLAQLQKLEAIGTLAGGIAHDFNNLLTVVNGNLEFAVALVDADHPVRGHLQEIQKASDRARSLVRQILAFSRGHEADRRCIDLAPIVGEVARFMRSTISKAIAIEVDTGDAVPPVLADAALVHQVLVNLCTNAWHAMEGRAGQLRIGLGAVDLDERAAGRIGGLRAGRHVCLSVEDTGVGMEAALQKRIFEPFFTTKPVGRGTGLGLSVVHGIVRGHGGGIEVASTPGVGTTFRVYLPAVAGKIVEREVRDPHGRGGGEHILLVEDEPALAGIMASSLERHGYRVTCLSNPEGLGRVLAGDAGPDLIVADYEMPGMSGLEVARRARELRPAVPVVLCSGYLKPEVLEEIEAAGIERVLAKPFAAGDLVVEIQRALRASRAR